jgi:hypothetical protein
VEGSLVVLRTTVRVIADRLSDPDISVMASQTTVVSKGSPSTVETVATTVPVVHTL